MGLWMNERMMNEGEKPVNESSFLWLCWRQLWAKHTHARPFFLMGFFLSLLWDKISQNFAVNTWANIRHDNNVQQLMHVCTHNIFDRQITNKTHQSRTSFKLSLTYRLYKHFAAKKNHFDFIFLCSLLLTLLGLHERVKRRWCKQSWNKFSFLLLNVHVCCFYFALYECSFHL